MNISAVFPMAHATTKVSLAPSLVAFVPLMRTAGDSLVLGAQHQRVAVVGSEKSTELNRRLSLIAL